MQTVEKMFRKETNLSDLREVNDRLPDLMHSLIVDFYLRDPHSHSQHELAMTFYPIFVHMYLKLVYKKDKEPAEKLIDRIGPKKVPVETILATGSLDCTLRLLDSTKFCEEISGENVDGCVVM